MREEKIRYVYKNKITGKLIYEYFTLEDIENMELSPIYYHTNWEELELISRDSFTGLKDKNGKEIYEGDILKTYPILASDKIGNQSFNVKVEFRGSCWISNGILGEYQCKISEIIGNIHEATNG